MQTFIEYPVTRAQQGLMFGQWDFFEIRKVWPGETV